MTDLQHLPAMRLRVVLDREPWRWSLRSDAGQARATLIHEDGTKTEVGPLTVAVRSSRPNEIARASADGECLPAGDGRDVPGSDFHG